MPGGTALPYPDCAYLARSEFADRLEVFYFGPEETLVEEITDQLADTGFLEQGDRWLLPDADGQPHAIARIEQFYAAPDASAEFRIYAELIAQAGRRRVDHEPPVLRLRRSGPAELERVVEVRRARGALDDR